MGKKVGIIPWHLPSYLTKHRGKSSNGGGWLLSTCRYPRTASFAEGRGGDREGGEVEKAATMDDINRFLCENFSSLYDGSVEDDDSGELVGECSSSGGGGSPLAPAPANDDHDDHGGRGTLGGPCEIVLASSSSQRFFPSSLGKSSSFKIMVDDDKATGSTATMTVTGRPSADDYASSTTTMTMTASLSSASASSCSPDRQRDTSTTDAGGGIPDDGVAVVTFSKDPQDDFLQSMEEMLDAHLSSSQLQRSPALVDWDFMQDLLLCYLHLNDAGVHAHILQAFADLVAELRIRKDVILSEEPGKRAGGGEARFHDGESDPAEQDVTDDDDDAVAPVVHGAMFSYSRY